MTKQECLSEIGKRWGVMHKHVAKAVWDIAYDEGYNDAVPKATDFANKSAICAVMVALHRLHGFTPEQLQNVWDETLNIIDEGSIEDLIDMVEKELNVVLVDSIGNPM